MVIHAWSRVANALVGIVLSLARCPSCWFMPMAEEIVAMRKSRVSEAQIVDLHRQEDPAIEYNNCTKQLFEPRG